MQYVETIAATREVLRRSPDGKLYVRRNYTTDGSDEGEAHRLYCGECLYVESVDPGLVEYVFDQDQR